MSMNARNTTYEGDFKSAQGANQGNDAGAGGANLATPIGKKPINVKQFTGGLTHKVFDSEGIPSIPKWNK